MVQPEGRMQVWASGRPEVLMFIISPFLQPGLSFKSKFGAQDQEVLLHCLNFVARYLCPFVI